MEFWSSKKITDKELLDNYKAFCDKMILRRFSYSDTEKYEQFLREIYKRNLKPPILLVPKESK